MSQPDARRILQATLTDEADTLRGIIRSYALRMGIATPADCERIADEILSDTASAALTAADKFDPDRRPIPWLLGIAVNRIRQRRTKQGRRQKREINIRDLYPRTQADRSDDDLFDQIAMWAQHPSSTLENQQQLAPLLAQLSSDEQTLLQRAIIEDLDATTIAAEMNITPTTVRVRLHRILKKLRRHAQLLNLEPDHVSDLEECV